MECVKCGQDFSTPFCPHCGQRSDVKRLTVRDVLYDFWNTLVGLDGIFLRTLKDLSYRPGHVAKCYVKGIRLHYFGPMGYFFFMVTLLLLWISVLGLDFAEVMQARQATISSSSQTAGLAGTTRWLSDNIKWVLFLAVPFQAVAARYFFFRKSGYNMIEHMVPLFYTSGHLFWLSMLTFLLRKLTGEMYTIPVAVLSLLYFGFVYSDLMRYQARVKSFIKGMGIYVAGQLLFILMLTAGIVLFVAFLAVADPEAFKAFKSATP